MTTTYIFGDAELQTVFTTLGVTPHPMMLLPSAEWVRGLMAEQPDDWQAVFSGLLEERQGFILKAEQDPLWHGWEFEPWLDSDKLLLGVWVSKGGYNPGPADVLGIFGGNRASKTIYAIRRACQTAQLFPRSTLAILSESETASIKTVQALVWYYFQPYYAAINGKRDTIHKINYSQSNGFTDRKLVLPNGSEMHFLTYNQEPGDYEGWEFGAPAHDYTTLRAKFLADGHPLGTFVPPNIGAVADESMPLSWLKMFARRLRFRHAKLLWSFTPVKGITPAIKELVGNSAVTLESRLSELLPRQNLPELAAGQMPYIRECQFPGIKAIAIYYFSLFNKFGPSPGRTYYDEIKTLCEGKTSEFVERVAYGFARDSVARAFPKFGAWNIVKRRQLPAVGTNYFFTDPAGARNWASLWVRVTAGGEHYIYRDWPDAQTYGEWAVPTEREVSESQRNGWDGDAGPAQNGLGLGIVRYKQVFLEAERIKVNRTNSDNVDPQHANRLAMYANDPEALKGLRERIAERYIDPRAGASEHMAEQGGTCIIDEFEEAQKGADGKVITPGMILIPASGVNEDEGLGVVNELLDWNEEQPLMPLLNQPKLFVSEDCLQVIWMFENYTGRGGPKGAAKDFADLVRYMALAKLFHVEQGRSGIRHGRGF